MLKCLGTCILFCFVNYSVHAQLTWVNPTPAGATCNKIIFINTDTGFIFNDQGNLIKTTDQGLVWKIIKTFPYMQHFDLVDSTAIIAGSQGVIYISDDNCSTWKTIYKDFNTSITGVDIISRDTIFLSSRFNIYKSFDRGQSWQTITVPNTIISCFDFINSSLGFVGKSEYSILKTTDGGITWQELFTINGFPSGTTYIKFFNADTGYAYRQFHHLLKTTNSGQTWTDTSIRYQVNAMSFPTANIGYMAGEDGSIYRSINGGNEWTSVPPVGGYNFGYDINSMYFINTDTGFATGSRGRILKTVNGGTSWQVYSLIYSDVTAFAFPDASTAYVASGNNLYKTTDSAKSWNLLPITSGNGYNSTFDKVYFFSNDTGFVTSTNYARINKTNDGGLTWRTINPGYYERDRTGGISFINDSTGFVTIMTNSGYLLSKTKDRGETWRAIDSSHFMGEPYDGIHFLDEKTGYALRTFQLYKTNDSAKTWTLLLTSDNGNFHDVWFLDERIGLVTGEYGLRRTIDSGYTWVTIPFNYNDRDIIALKFVNDKLAFATCSSGAIYLSSDSGATWLPYSKTANPCKNMTSNKTGMIYFGGTNGSILSANAGYIALYVDYKCVGNSMTFKSNLVGASYSWEVNRNYGGGFTPINDDLFTSGTKTGTITLKYTFDGWQGYQYRCIVDGAKTSNISTLEFQTHWTGAVDNNWETAGNWSCGNVPDPNSEVLIGNGDVILHSNASVRTLKIAVGGSLTINSGYKLTVVH